MKTNGQKEYNTHIVKNIQNGNVPRFLGWKLLFCLLRNQGPQPLDTDNRAKVLVPCQMVMTHANLSKVTRMTACIKPKTHFMKVAIICFN